MTDQEKIDRMTCNWDSVSENLIQEEFAAKFLICWNEMKQIEAEEAEEARVEHARKMSRPRR